MSPVVPAGTVASTGPVRGAVPVRATEVELFSLAGHDGYLHHVNDAFERLLGLTAGGAEGRSLLEFVHPQDLAGVVEAFFQLEHGRPEILLHTRFLVTDRSVVHLQWVMRPVEGDARLWWAAGRDVTAFQRAVADAVDLRSRLELAVGSASVAMWDMDPWVRTMTWEAQAAELFGVDPDAVPEAAADLLVLVHPGDRAAVAETVEQLHAGADAVEVDFRLADPPGTRSLRLRGRTVDRDRRGRGRRAIGLVLDVSAEKALQDQMLTMMMSDALTGVPNRRAFDQELRSAVRGCARAGSPVSVAMVDVDDFKRFNDTFGHRVGDDVLCTVSRALVDQLGAGTGVLARYGGEEFAAVLPGMDAAAVREFGRTLVLAVRGTRLRQADDWPLTVSVGTASWSPGEPAVRPAGLLEVADRALYAAKRSGKDRAVHG